MELKGCIFDLDGVIVDTAKYHFMAWRRLAKELGFEFTLEHNEALKGVSGEHEKDARWLLSLCGDLIRTGVWIMGGDGWAYDIGFGGLDQALSSGRDVNILVLDTQVYSNTGGQASKATPRGAVAKFAAAGKGTGRKDLGAIARAYGNVYVAQIALGANDAQTVRAFIEAEAYDGPSLIIAYSHCIAHGYDMAKGLDQQKLAVDTGYWPLFRFDPRRAATGESPLVLDSPAPKLDLAKYTGNEMRFRVVEQMDPARFKMLSQHAQQEVARRVSLYEQLAKMAFPVTKA